MERDRIRLMGPHEVREALGVSRQWAAQITNRKGFPEPVVTLRIGPVWLAEDVEAWIDQNRPDVRE